MKGKRATPAAKSAAAKATLALIREYDDDIIVRCFGLDGVEVLQLRASGSDLARQTSKELALQLNSDMQDPRVILPDGELLDVVCRANPNATLVTVSLKHGKAGGA